MADRWIDYVPLDDIVRADENPRDHDLDLIAASMRRFGFADAPVHDGRTGRLIAGHGRLEALQLIRSSDDPAAPAGVEVRDGVWWVPVQYGWSSADDREAEAMLVVLNRATEVATWRAPELAAMLERVAATDLGLEGVGYTPPELEAMLAATVDEPDLGDHPGGGASVYRPKREPVRRDTPSVVRVLHGDCVALLADLPECSIDAVVCDPPYELAFMGKGWDDAGVAFAPATWAAVLRVLKPGGHLLAFGGTRTYHRMAVAIEDAGFEVRDSLHWIYGSGFPKSMDVSKAIDRHHGVERPDRVTSEPGDNAVFSPSVQVLDAQTPVTADAERWQGWGTALKPAHEPVVVARRPVEGTVAANVLRWGTGGLNIDGTRTEMSDEDRERFARGSEAWAERDERLGGGVKHADVYGTYGASEPSEAHEDGRWPANVMLDEHAAAVVGDEARFFPVFRYEPKASTAERNAGLDHLEGRARGEDVLQYHDGVRRPDPIVANFHPTVKPIDLMRWLIRLVTPPGGTVLDPFAGSGTTLVAAVLEGMDAVGCEMTPEYWPIIDGRVAWAHTEAAAVEVES